MRIKAGLIIAQDAGPVGIDDVFAEEDIIAWVQKNYYPHDVFPADELCQWAEENGFVKEQEE